MHLTVRYDEDVDWVIWSHVGTSDASTAYLPERFDIFLVTSPGALEEGGVQHQEARCTVEIKQFSYLGSYAPIPVTVDQDEAWQEVKTEVSDAAILQGVSLAAYFLRQHEDGRVVVSRTVELQEGGTSPRVYQNEYVEKEVQRLRGQIDEVRQKGREDRPQRRSRRQLTDKFLRSIAEIYRETTNDSSGSSPNQMIAEQLGVSNSTAAYYVQKTRAKGFLGPALRGRAGELTWEEVRKAQLVVDSLRHELQSAHDAVQHARGAQFDSTQEEDDDDDDFRSAADRELRVAEERLHAIQRRIAEEESRKIRLETQWNNEQSRQELHAKIEHDAWLDAAAEGAEDEEDTYEPDEDIERDR